MTSRVGGSKVDYLSKEESEALEKFTRGVRSLLGDNLLILKLFGSKARGDFSEEFDIDILLVVKEITSKLRDKIFDLLLDIDLEYDPKISLAILKVNASQAFPQSLTSNISKSFVCVYYKLDLVGGW